MKIEVVLSPSGLGKTNYILKDIDKEKDNSNIIVITPEQNGYNLEKELCLKFNSTFNIDVMNFKTLYKMLGKKLLIDDSEIISDEVKLFYYLQIIKELENKDNNIIKRMLQDNNFIETVDDTIKEFREYNISPKKLSEYVITSEKENKNKILDLLEIYEKYIEFLKKQNKLDYNNFIDTIISEIELIDLSNYVFYIDAYFNFNKQEYEIIKQLIKHSKKVVIAVTGDINRYSDINFELDYNKNYKYMTLDDINNNYKYSLDIYRKSHEIVANLNQIVIENNIEFYNIITFIENSGIINCYKLYLENTKILNYKKLYEYSNSRYDNKDLKVLVNEYPKIIKSSISNYNNIQILKANNLEEEIRIVAREIFKLKKLDNSIKDNDIAILYRNNNYERYINIFSDYNINLHLDKDEDVTNHRFIKLIINLFNYDEKKLNISMSNIFKSQLVDLENIYNNLLLKYKIFNTLDISDDKLKKYLKNNLEENIEISNFKKITYIDLEKVIEEKLVYNIKDLDRDYFLESNGYYSTEDLIIFKQILKIINNKIKKFLSQKTLSDFIKKLEDIFNYFNINMFLEKHTDSYDELEELKLESIDRQVYSKFLKILYNINKNVNMNISIDEFQKILFMAIKNIKYRNIPEINNFVIMANMDLAKVENKKIVFLIGFNKDIIPSKITDNGIIDDNDKILFLKENINLSPTSKSMLIDEEFVSYIALSRAREKLYISYSEFDSSYKEQKESIYINNIKLILKNIQEKKIDDVININNSTISDYIELYQDKNSYYKEIYSKKELIYIYNKILKIYSDIDIESFKVKLLEILNDINAIKKCIRRNENLLTDNELYSKLNDKTYFNYEIDNEYNHYAKLVYTDKINIEYKKKIEENRKNVFSNYSISKINSYTNNQYSYFVNYILNVNNIQKYVINPLNKGTFIHSVLSNNEIKDYIIKTSEKIATLYDEEEYEKQINLEEILKIVKNLVYNSIENNIINFTRLSLIRNVDKYLLEKEIKRLVNTIAIEIKYSAITGYNIYQTEKYFSFEISQDKIDYEIDGKKYSKKLLKKYNVDKIKFSGSIDRIDKKNNNYLLIDYKNSETDFKYINFYNGEASQLLIYMLALETLYEKNYESILGVFYREISSINLNYNKYRLRGLINKDILLQEDFSKNISNVAYTRVTKNNDIHASDKYKAYSSNEFNKILNINIDNILKVIDKINNFEFNVDDELVTLYKMSLNESVMLDKNYEKISNKIIKEKILEIKI